MRKLGLIVGLVFGVLFVNAQSKVGDDSQGVAKNKGSKKYDFLVTYVNGDTREVSSTIDINYCMRTMFLEDEENQEAIYPAETKLVERIMKDGSTMRGTPRDSFWVFQIHEGKLNTYSTLPHNKVKNIEFLEKDGVWTEMTPGYLRKALSDNEEATALYGKSVKNRTWARRMGTWVSPLVVVGLFTGPKMGIDFAEFEDLDDDGENDLPLTVSYLHFTSAAMIGSTFLFKRYSKRRMEQAFDTYNK